MIIRALVVVTMDCSPIENGAIAISGNKIVDVGKFPEISARHSGEEVVDLGDQALLPGLINAHCHLDYTCLRGKIPRPKSFTDWIRALNSAKTKLSADDYVTSIKNGFAQAQSFGTTTIANLTAFPELIAHIREPIRTWWFAELIDVRDPRRAHEQVALAAGLLQSTKHWGLAPHAPFTASAKLYRRCEEVARANHVLLTTHLAESSEEMSMFRDASGSLYDFLKEIGRDMSDCRSKTPLQSLLAKLGRGGSVSRSEPDWCSRPIEGNYPYPSWLLVHLNELSKNDLDLLQTSTAKFFVVHCPSSHNYFGHSRFQFEKLKELGINVCIGTDSLASNDNLSLFAEMRALQKKFPDIPAEEILLMVTRNAACALNQEKALGKIAVGCQADLIAIPSSETANLFEKIIAFDQPVDWSMIDGVVQVL